MINSLRVYLFSYNNSLIIRHVIEYYRQFTNDITVIDNYSTDGTRQILQEMRVKVVNDLNNGKNNEMYLLQQKNGICNRCNKYTGGIIICDADEVLYADGNRNLIDVLNYWIKNGYKIIKPHGYEMISEDVPIRGIMLHEQFKMGVRNPDYDKTILMHSDVKPRFQAGCHKSFPSHPYVEDPTLKLLHFRCVGGVDRLISKFKEREAMQSNYNIKHKYGIHYSQTEAQLRDWWNYLKSNAVECVV